MKLIKLIKDITNNTKDYKKSCLFIVLEEQLIHCFAKGPTFGSSLQKVQESIPTHLPDHVAIERS